MRLVGHTFFLPCANMSRMHGPHHPSRPHRPSRPHCPLRTLHPLRTPGAPRGRPPQVGALTMDLVDLEIRRTEHRANEEGISPAMVAQKALDASTGAVQLQDRSGLGMSWASPSHACRLFPT